MSTDELTENRVNIPDDERLHNLTSYKRSGWAFMISFPGIQSFIMVICSFWILYISLKLDLTHAFSQFLIVINLFILITFLTTHIFCTLGVYDTIFKVFRHSLFLNIYHSSLVFANMVILIRLFIKNMEKHNQRTIIISLEILILLSITFHCVTLRFIALVFKRRVIFL